MSSRPGAPSLLTAAITPHQEETPTPLSPRVRRTKTIEASLRDDDRQPEQTTAHGQTEPDEDQGGARSARPLNHQGTYFTLVEDAVSTDCHHPHVHYIFEDDDPELLTAASIRALGGKEILVTDQGEGKSEQEHSQKGLLSPLPPIRDGVEERYIIIDIAEDGQSIQSARCLSHDWQVVNTQITAAPTWDDAAADDNIGNLMINIQGSGILTEDMADDLDGLMMLQKAAKSENEDLLAAMERLAASFQEGMQVLHRAAEENRF